MSFEELMQDQQFVSRLYDAQDIDAVRKLFAEAGLDISDKELMQHILPNDEELDEEELEEVSGGTLRINPFFNWLRRRWSRGGHRF